jgi:hypothetical protein
MPPILRSCLTVLLTAVLCVGCDESDVVAIRVRLQGDFSGEVATSSVRIPEPAAPMEHVTAGIEWDDRLDMVCARGTFANLGDLSVEDITFEVGHAGEKLNYLEVTLPRGPEARWPRTLVQLSEEERVAAAKTLDPTGRLREVGGLVKIEIELDERVVGHGITVRARGAKEKAEGSKATLVVPIESSLEAEEPLVWHLTWRRK